jgi:hypothetical protein
MHVTVYDKQKYLIYNICFFRNAHAGSEVSYKTTRKQVFQVHMLHKRMKYNNPSFATKSQRAFYSTCDITTCFGLHLSHHQVLSNKEYQV